MNRAIVATCTLAVLAGCGRPSGPTKENAVQTLRDLCAACEAKEYEKAAGYLKMPAEMGADEAKRACAGLLEKQEISPKGIDVLAARGKWGKLEEVFPGKAKMWADRMKAPLEQCYGLGYDNAEAGFCWDGSAFKLIRCDDIGKIEDK